MGIHGTLMFLNSEFGPSSWTASNWLGVGISVGAFVVSVWLVYRISRPKVDVDRGGDGRES